MHKHCSEANHKGIALPHNPTACLAPPLRVIYVGATDHYENAFRRAQALHKLGMELLAIPMMPEKSRRLAVRILHHVGHPPDWSGAERRFVLTRPLNWILGANATCF